MKLPRNFFGATVLLALFAVILPIEIGHSEEKDFRLTNNPGVREISPEPPVKVKLKKLADGTYTWEISGTSIKRIIEADMALKKYTGTKARKTH